MARYNLGYRARYEYLIRKGFLDWEASVIASGYRTFRITGDKSDPARYIRRMVRGRINTIINLRRYGYSDDKIIEFILGKYIINNWTFTDGRLNTFKMLEQYRRVSMDAGEYFPKARRHGRSKGLSISRGDVKAQRARARVREREKKGKSTLDDYETRRGR